MGRITVFGGPERRQRWRTEEQRRILEETFAPGACVAQVAPASRRLVDLYLAAAGKQEDHGFVEAVVLEHKAARLFPDSR